MTAYELGRILWEARLMEAWGKHHGPVMIARNPWPPHMTHPTEVATQHELAYAEAKALLKICEVILK